MEQVDTKDTVIETSVVSGGVKLWGRYHAANEPTEHTVLLVRGDGAGEKSCHEVQKRLLLAGMNVYRFDWAGQGSSEGVYSELTLTRACGNLLDQLNFMAGSPDIPTGKISVVASSFGGSVLLASLGAIAKTGISLSHIVLKSAASFLPGAFEYGLRKKGGIEQWQKEGISSVFGLSFEAYRDSLRHNTLDIAGLVECPVLLVHGDADLDVPVQHSRRLAVILDARAHLTVLGGCTHDYSPSFLGVFADLAVQFVTDTYVPPVPPESRAEYSE